MKGNWESRRRYPGMKKALGFLPVGGASRTVEGKSTLVCGGGDGFLGVGAQFVLRVGGCLCLDCY